MSKQKGQPVNQPKKTPAPVQQPVRPPQPEPKRQPEARKAATPVVLPFGQMNYILLLACIGVIALGFILMAQDGFVDATQFSVSLHIAPPVVVAGFVGVIFAIMYRPKSAADDSNG
ncbi:MAG: DUF3098 domain-containing protein [Bacteroidia bacterium]|nr:DUF3098 domain-containing protein [Bacteroidia bacterium]